MSVEHKAEFGTYYPPMDLDTVQDAEVVMDPDMLPVNFEQLHIAAAKRERKDDRHDHTEDAVYNDPNKFVFGVFDGAGGAGGNPAAASRAAAEAVGGALSETDNVVSDFVAAKEDLQKAFVIGRQAVEERGEGGVTVATAAKVYSIEGKAALGIAHAGDTRAFLYNKTSNEFYPLTPDQSNRNVIFNSLDNKYHSQADQFDLIPLNIGDRVMMCSDGITGDYPEQFFSNEEFIEAFSQSSAEESAEKFMQISLGDNKKRDDKSVLVIDFDTLVSEPEDQPEESSNTSEATRRSVTKRQENARRLREALGLPYTATAEEVSKARKAQRSNSTEVLDDVDIMEAFANDTELQQQIEDAMAYKSGYTITDKRVWDRETGKAKSKDKTAVIPAMPDYQPTVHLRTAGEAVPKAADTAEEVPTEAIPVQPESTDTPVVERMSLKEKLRHPLAYLGGQMDAYRVIHQNKLEEKYSSEQLAKRNENQEKALKGLLAATAAALIAVTAFKLGHDLGSIQGLSTEVGNADGDWVTKAPSADTPAPLQPTPPEFSAAASTVTNGEGWYQTIQETTGITDQTQQAAILQKIGPALQEKGWAYVMPNGTWGISHPGTLPKDVLELIKNSR